MHGDFSYSMGGSIDVYCHVMDNEDGWKDVKDPAERKRLQNRLRQRAWRKLLSSRDRRLSAQGLLHTDCSPFTLGHKRLSLILSCERKKAIGHMNESTINYSPWKGYGMLINSDQHQLLAKSTSGPLHHPTHRIPEIGAVPKISNRPKLIPPLLSYTKYTTFDAPPPHIVLPLSPDHCLITLVQYNVIRAMLFNVAILSLLDYLPKGCPNTLSIPQLGTIPAQDVPPDLQYTALQQTTPHSYWISVIPFPQLRDNLILLAGTYDEYEFCCDLGLGIYEGFDDVERRGFLVWGQAWHGHGWEISEGFIRKWGFLLKGCSELIESTNYWRELRGEDRLIVEI
ncbi:conserved hypothetical protein [Talaromyces stipitatus ATCC 10500]|uniref:BZIP domain-containing protein n=1 Tax=Talaromyces stipitatus (strain ATCC 10500 / CBS 375.48 / QM 6759 / NRRL 1006) TaxID=441959 RepID=B8M3N5_TALSN|nr:uncharacterized protein TSTA_096560 [Talaromyces stipitatus ATCC 10500]EED22407.1 conserved hypothetical protein [Talaromyces stipitatus ATCC 10500]